MAKLPKPTLPTSRPSRTELIALALSVLWMLGVAVFFIRQPPAGDAGAFDSLRFVMTLIALFLPVAMIWVVAATARSARVMRDEAARLHVAIDAIRQVYLNDLQGKGPKPVLEPAVERKLAEIAQVTRKTETALATFTSSRDGQKLRAGRKAAPADDQPTLALGTTADDMPHALINSDLIRALNFPDTDQDTRGFDALRRALKDRNARVLVQASQDLLTLLAQDGIYMDDLEPERSRPELWRRFAHGERGRPIAALGGIRDRSSLALATGRMREDTAFRDKAHDFLRKFDQMLQSFEQIANDEELAALSDTRTARAFMLMGRVTGAFD